MARRRRLLIPGCPLHIVQRAYSRQPCFFHRSDHHTYRLWLHEYAQFHGIAIHAYVLMTNHIHLLASAENVQALSAFMKALSQRYAQYLNRRFDRKGTWWEGRFWSSPVVDERYVLTCHRYIELNPVRAGMTVVAADYAWSSYAGNAGLSLDDLLTPHPIYKGLHANCRQRFSNYRELLGECLPQADLDAIRTAIRGNRALGEVPLAK